MEGTRSEVIVIMDKPNQPNSTKEEKPQTPGKSLRRLSFSKPKSRFTEYSKYSYTESITEKSDHEENESDDDDEDDDGWSSSEANDEEMKPKRYQKKKKKLPWRLYIEWVMFFTILTFLICSLTIKSVKNKSKWGLEIWKWCLMVMVTFCGRLVSGWVMGFVVFFIERKFMLRDKVLYFVYGLRKSIQNCIWLGLVLLAWTLMFNQNIQSENKILKKVFQALVAILLAAIIWLIKIALVKTLASSFHVTTYFDRMKESVFHHYILETLSGPPMEEPVVTDDEEKRQHLRSYSLPVSLKNQARNELRSESKRSSSRKLDLEKLKKLSLQKVSAWSVKRLMNYVKSSGLSTISKTVDDFGKAESEITSEWEARNSAKRIFRNVAKPGAKFIEEEDLGRFLNRIEIHTIFPLFEGALETGRISKSAFKNWVVRAYFERKSLAHSLNDTKTAVQQLHKLASAFVVIIIIVVTLLVMELANLKIVLVVGTQLVVLGVVFQNMCKTMFESIVFVFIMHPFDIGDRCVVDGVQMIVEEMNILTTVFLRYDMEKIYYPNSVLLTKPISNFYRSPEMGDGIEFSVDISTPMDTIVALKKAIQLYIESKPNYWNPKHTVVVKEIDISHHLKMALYVQHTINYQNYGERNIRISELILELKKIFENLSINYHLLPQEIHLTQLNTEALKILFKS